MVSRWKILGEHFGGSEKSRNLRLAHHEMERSGPRKYIWASRMVERCAISLLPGPFGRGRTCAPGADEGSKRGTRRGVPAAVGGRGAAVRIRECDAGWINSAAIDARRS